MNPRLINSPANSFATESGIAANGGASTTKQRVFGWTHAMALALAVGCIAFGLSGCGQGKAASAAPPPPQVHVATASTGEVVDWDTFTGRFEAPETVKLRPRVSGYIDQVRFAEGRDVKKGDVLFVIDQRPYQVQFERTQADYVRMQARSQLAASELARSQKLLAAHAVSQEEYDQRASERAQARADELAAHAAMNAAKLNLEYTQVTSPIDGRISRAEVTTGNYVSAGETILTSLVSLDPIYVYFEGDEQTYLKYMNLAKLGERPSSRENANPVFIGLANEDDFPHAGKMNFVDNALSPETGTIRARAQIDNPEHLFTPGMLARVKLQGSGKYQATLIDDEAVVTDQDRKYVMVVNAQNVIEYRAVELKGIFNNQRIVSGGLQPGERIVVSGLQRVRPGMTVAPQETNATANDNTQPRPNVRKVAATNIETATAQTVNY